MSDELTKHVVTSDVNIKGVPVISWNGHMRFWTRVHDEERCQFDMRAYVHDGNDNNMVYVEAFGEKGLRGGIHTRVEAYKGSLAENDLKSPEEAENYHLTITIPKKTLDEKGLFVSRLEGSGLLRLVDYAKEAAAHGYEAEAHNRHDAHISCDLKVLPETTPRQSAELLHSVAVQYIQVGAPLDNLEEMLVKMDEVRDDVR